MKISDYVYCYSINNQVYFLDHEVKFQKRKLKLKNYQNRIQKKLEEEAFGIDTVSKKKINYKHQFRNLYDQVLLPFFLVIFVLKEKKEIQQVIVCNKMEQKMKNINSQEEFVEFLQLLEEILNQSFDTEFYELIVSDLLFKNFPSKKEGFWYYASRCILANSNFTRYEKVSLKQECFQKIRIYGDYYSGYRILVALLAYANVGVQREYGLSFASYQKSKGNYGFIVYDPSWPNASKVLHHELCHAELKEESCLPIYHEVRAAFLSKSGYSKSRALFTILGLLGNEEEVIKGLINNHPRLIWNSIKEEVASDYKVEYFEELLEIICDDSKLENSTAISIGIYEILQELYLEKYNFPMSKVPVSYVLSYLFINGAGKYTTDDDLVLHGHLPLLINKVGIKKEVMIPITAEYSIDELKEEETSMLVEYLKTEIQDSNRSYETTASYYIESIFGKQNYFRFLSTKHPFRFLNFMNRLRHDAGVSQISTEMIETIIQKAHKNELHVLEQEEWYLNLLEVPEEKMVGRILTD